MREMRKKVAEREERYERRDIEMIGEIKDDTVEMRKRNAECGERCEGGEMRVRREKGEDQYERDDG